MTETAASTAKTTVAAADELSSAAGIFHKGENDKNNNSSDGIFFADDEEEDEDFCDKSNNALRTNAESKLFLACLSEPQRSRAMRIFWEEKVHDSDGSGSSSSSRITNRDGESDSNGGDDGSGIQYDDEGYIISISMIAISSLWLKNNYNNNQQDNEYIWGPFSKLTRLKKLKLLKFPYDSIPHQIVQLTMGTRTSCSSNSRSRSAGDGDGGGDGGGGGTLTNLEIVDWPHLYYMMSLFTCTTDDIKRTSNQNKNEGNSKKKQISSFSDGFKNSDSDDEIDTSLNGATIEKIMTSSRLEELKVIMCNRLQIVPLPAASMASHGFCALRRMIFKHCNRIDQVVVIHHNQEHISTEEITGEITQENISGYELQHRYPQQQQQDEERPPSKKSNACSKSEISGIIATESRPPVFLEELEISNWNRGCVAPLLDILSSQQPIQRLLISAQLSHYATLFPLANTNAYTQHYSLRKLQDFTINSFGGWCFGSCSGNSLQQQNCLSDYSFIPTYFQNLKRIELSGRCAAWESQCGPCPEQIQAKSLLVLRDWEGLEEIKLVCFAPSVIQELFRLPWWKKDGCGTNRTLRKLTIENCYLKGYYNEILLNFPGQEEPPPLSSSKITSKKAVLTEICLRCNGIDSLDGFFRKNNSKGKIFNTAILPKGIRCLSFEGNPILTSTEPKERDRLVQLLKLHPKLKNVGWVDNPFDFTEEEIPDRIFNEEILHLLVRNHSLGPLQLSWDTIVDRRLPTSAVESPGLAVSWPIMLERVGRCIRDEVMPEYSKYLRCGGADKETTSVKKIFANVEASVIYDIMRQHGPAIILPPLVHQVLEDRTSQNATAPKNS